MLRTRSVVALTLLTAAAWVGFGELASMEAQANFGGCTQEKDFEYAIRACTSIIDQGKRARRQDRAIAYYMRGRAHFVIQRDPRSQGELDRAIADFSSAIELEPNYVEAYTRRGRAYASMKQHNRAIADYSKVIKLKPRSSRTYNRRGNVYADKGELERAIADYDKAIKLNPNDSAYYVNRGDAYEAKGQPRRAIADFSRAIELRTAYYIRMNRYGKRGGLDAIISDPDKPIKSDTALSRAFSYRANAYRKTKQFDHAISDMRKAISLDPGRQHYRSVLRQLEAARN